MGCDTVHCHKDGSHSGPPPATLGSGHHPCAQRVWLGLHGFCDRHLLPLYRWRLTHIQFYSYGAEGDRKTTDHPNGAPFTTYPHLIRLLMDRHFRNERLAGLNQAAAKASTLAAIRREYSLYEIAIMTRAAQPRASACKTEGIWGLGPGPILRSIPISRTRSRCSVVIPAVREWLVSTTGFRPAPE